LWRLIREVALGGIHPIRRSVIDYLAVEEEAHVASTIAARCGLRETTVRRHLDDLVALNVLDVVGMNPMRLWVTSGIADTWVVAAGGRAFLRR
jgi:predicted ArsR family transcriptional regulator